MRTKLKQSILEHMETISLENFPIIYESFRINEDLRIEIMVIIVKIREEYMLYESTFHSTGNLNIKYIRVNEDMFNIMANS